MNVRRARIPGDSDVEWASGEAVGASAAERAVFASGAGEWQSHPGGPAQLEQRARLVLRPAYDEGGQVLGRLC